MKKHKTPGADKIQISKLSDKLEGFTGAEIEQLILSAMYSCFDDDKRSVTTKDLLDLINNTVPQSVTCSADLIEMRKHAQGRLSFASGDGKSKTITEEMTRKLLV